MAQQRFSNRVRTAPGQELPECHIAGITNPERGVELAHIASRIALVQDDTYPQTAGTASRKDLTVRYREQGFRRHELLGLNAFLLETFRQFPAVLGVRETDYMTGSSNALDDAIGNVVRQARKATATVAVRAHIEGRTVVADVEVTNLTGHRFPSGVSFRRAFLEVALRDTTAPAGATPLFVSGSTDARGRIIDGEGNILPSESFARAPSGAQRYQEHFDEAHPITGADQVQIRRTHARRRRKLHDELFAARPGGQGQSAPSAWLERGRSAASGPRVLPAL